MLPAAAVQGYNGSQLWDTSFAVQAMLDSGLTDVAAGALKKAHAYIEQSQVWQCSSLTQGWFVYFMRARGYDWGSTEKSARLH